MTELVPGAAAGGERGCGALQRTIARPVECRGVGIHTGVEARLVLRPAPAGAGLRILRTDVAPGRGEIPADIDHVVCGQLATTVANIHGTSVATVEHLMAAMYGCAVDNAVIEVDGPEIPAMDGSAGPFVKMIEEAGVRDQDAPRRAIRVLSPVVVGDGAVEISLAPADSLVIEFAIGFQAPAIGRQSLAVELVNGAFADDLASARTFGLREDIDRLRASGRGLGGSFENVVVVDGMRVLNPGGLRFADEFVRHKIVDCIGDLGLAGAPILGRVVARRSGHAANHSLLRALFARPDAWTYVDAAPVGPLTTPGRA